MLSRLIRQILFVLLHLVVSVLVAIQNVYHRFCVKMSNLPKNQTVNNEVMTVLGHVPLITKELKHLVVLVDTDHHTLTDLARVVIWSLVFGISYVSFHDITGKLQKDEENLFVEVEKQKKGIPGCIKWFDKPNLNGYTNGIQANTISVNILSYNDGRPKITKCLQQISQDNTLCIRSSDEFTSQELDRTLKTIYPSIPDPNLVLYSGPLCCAYGLLPWHIRLTEFIQISIDHSINVNNYLGALYKYNKCDLRFGK
ncbi:unnamed protein product [Pieris macdunnoughi]|uniref:ditrans,polycis-polyprenyl diphosphate synthase [(2E,6E)-farnesyldiphosphate specific] n=1 Tax=Pieris macdunnoughi TaxID=345717 RepID=A0A821XY97_9NEOP|nr:unnamed protein product [Pieris macdunnoughi]